MRIFLLVLGLIQLWRRVTDSALIDECTDDIVIDDLTVRNSGGICFERVRSRKYMSIIAFLTELIIVQSNESLLLISALLLLLIDSEW